MRCEYVDQTGHQCDGKNHDFYLDKLIQILSKKFCG